MFAIIITAAMFNTIPIANAPKEVFQYTIVESQIQKDLEAMQSDPQALHYLLQHIGGANNLRSYQLSGLSLLENAVRLKLPNAALAIVQEGADVNAKSSEGSSILSFVMKQMVNNPLQHDDAKCWVPVAIAMIQQGAYITSNVTNDSPFLAALCCAQQDIHGDYSILKEILARNVDINMVFVDSDKNEVTSPLILAVNSHDAILVKFLLDHGARKDLTVTDPSALSVATRFHQLYEVYQHNPAQYPTNWVFGTWEETFQTLMSCQGKN